MLLSTASGERSYWAIALLYTSALAKLCGAISPLSPCCPWRYDLGQFVLHEANDYCCDRADLDC
ncbi:hypothetical protein [Thermoleptolyngbya sp.]